MAMQVVMPRLSDTMEEGKILRWLKKEGDRVEGGDIIAEIQTDKADIEMEAFGSGTLRKILTRAGESAPVGRLIGVIAENDEDISILLSPTIDSALHAAQSDRPGAPVPVSAPLLQAVPSGRIKASPLAKRLAREQGIDLSMVKGSGPGGRVIRRDIAALASSALAAMTPSAAAAGQRAPSISPAPSIAEQIGR